MPTTGFDALYEELGQLEHAIEYAIEMGMEEGAEIITTIGQSTAAYEDKTEATRTSTIGFVVGFGRDGSDATGKAIAAAEEKNPGSSLVFESEPLLQPEQAAIVLTAFTGYSEQLEVKHAGEHAFIGPSMQQGAFAADAAIARNIQEVTG